MPNLDGEPIVDESPATYEWTVFPLPDPPATEGERVWELTVVETELRETLAQPKLEQLRQLSDALTGA